MKKYFFFVVLFINSICFGQGKEMGSQDSSIMRCSVIEKSFVMKNGKPSEFSEMYLRCSDEDYFIKFCKSEVTVKQMKKFINKEISVVMEIREGSWDICEDDPIHMQSRIGKYVVIHSIENH